MNRVILSVVCLAVVVVCSAGEEQASARAVRDTASDDGKPVGAAANADDSGKFFLFAQRSTTTSFLISTSTTSILSTCFKAISATSCSGRRRRRFVHLEKIPLKIEDQTIDSSLSGSIAADNEVSESKKVPTQSSKYFFTLWDTSVSTLLVVDTSTNNVNIVSISAQCSIPGATYTTCA